MGDDQRGREAAAAGSAVARRKEAAEPEPDPGAPVVQRVPGRARKVAAELVVAEEHDKLPVEHKVVQGRPCAM